MGTRGIMGVRVDGQDKLTYNHFDSYPSSLGCDMARDVMDILAGEGLEWFKEMAELVSKIGGI